MKNSRLLFGMFLGCLAHVCAGTDATQIEEIQNKIEKISTTTASGNLGAKTAPASSDLDSRGWNLSLDVLYWQTKIQVEPFCTTNDGLVNSPINSTQTRNHEKFDWSWGFKVGAGYHFDHDSWDSRAEYTYFRNTAKGTIGPLNLPSGVESKLVSDGYSLTYDSWSDYSGDNVSFVYASQAKQHLKNAYNDVYLDLGRDFFVSECLSIRPAMGVEASWFSFKGSAEFTGGAEVDYIFDPIKNVDGTVWGGLGNGILKKIFSLKSVGVGPKLSLDSTFHLCNGFSLYGNGNGALLFSYFKQHSNLSYSLKPNNRRQLINNFHSVIPTAKIDLGIKYDSNVVCDTQHIGISLGYETLYYWNTFGYSSKKTFEGVGMYGVNLKVKWDF